LTRTAEGEVRPGPAGDREQISLVRWQLFYIKIEK